MKAVTVNQIGVPVKFEVADLEIPKPGKGMILLKMSAAALNYSDVQIAGGFYPGHSTNRLPFVAGREGAGVVAEVGEGVSNVTVGDEVMALGMLGAFAEYALCHSRSASYLPNGWSFTSAAGFQLGPLSAVAAIEQCARVKPGETVLVQAAAGTFGQAAIRLCKHLGAHVIATASKLEKLEIARACGADEVINYTEDDFVATVKALTHGKGVDVVLDTVGGDVLRGSLQSVRPFGIVLVAGNASNSPVDINHYDLLSTYRCSVIGFELGTMIIQRPDLMANVRGRFAELVDSGVFLGDEPNTCTIEETPQRLGQMADRELVGNWVIKF